MRRERKPSEENVEIGQRLTKARLQAGYETAADAVDHMDRIEYPTYKSHENGWRGMSRKDARYYAHFYRVSIDWLWDGAGPMKGKPMPAEHRDILDGLPPEGRKQALEYIDFLKGKFGI